MPQGLYKYTPNRAAGIAFGTLFGLVTMGSCFFTVQMARYKQTYLVPRQYNKLKLLGAYLPFLAGCILEVIGYAARCFNPDSLDAYIVQTILLLIAPAFYAATIYMLFGRIAYLLFAEKLLIMPAKFSTLIFVLGDVLSLLLQAAGGGLMSNQSSSKEGSHIVIGGLFVQIAIFGLFICNELLFLTKIHKITSKIVKFSRNFMILNNILLLGSILIFIRSIVRAVEFIQGSDGTIMTHEWFLYVFDTTPIFLTSLLFTISIPWSNIFVIQDDSLRIQMEFHTENEESEAVTENIEMGSRKSITTYSPHIS